jgi:L-alanine-DL-glutamate epimerase-like enolase superfamily enzyme
MTGYYDFVLGLIPLTLGGITGLLTISGFALTTAIPLASIVAVGLIGHAMFVRAPVDSPPTSTSRSEPVQAAD